MQIREYLSQKGFHWAEKKRNGGIEAIMNCPFCGDTKKKFAINLSTGAFKCMHENSCAVRGSFWDFQRDLGDEPKHLINDRRFVKPKKKVYKKPKVAVTEPESKVTEYLKSRGFSGETISHFKIGQKDNAIMLPYYKDGELVNVKYRDGKKRMWNEKDAEPTLFNRDNIKTNELIITEGEFDTMALHQYGLQSVSVPNGVSDFRWIDNEWEWLEKFKVIYLCFDNDIAGQKGALELVAKLGAWRCRNVVFPEKDANECLIKGILKEKMFDCLSMAVDFPPANLVTADIFLEEVVDLFANPDKLSGISTAWEKLDKYLRGWRLEELTVWSGRNGSGKSTILNQHILDLANKGVKCCVASLEMPPARYLRWAVMQHTYKAHPDKFEITSSMEWMGERIYIINTTEEATPQELLDIFEYAARRYNVKHFVVDSLMRVRFLMKEELKEHKSFVSSLLSFAKKHKCHVHLVAHPRKGLRDGDKPGKVDIMGTGHITDLAHNVLIMWRPDEEEKENAERKGKHISDAVLYVKKNREFGIEGGMRLTFNPDTKRFTD